MYNPDNDSLINWFPAMKNFAGSHADAPREFINFIKGQPCVLCHKPADHPHHIYGSYGSLKTSSIFVVPLCATCHGGIDLNPRRFELILFWAMLAHSFIEQTLKGEL